MKKRWLILIMFGAGLLNQALFASTCPDPETSSLQWGEVPESWSVSPFSVTPQGEANTRFVRANIMVAGLGRGIVCTYHNSLGDYSIWRQVLVKIPAPVDYNWIDTLGGFVCTASLVNCQFNTAQ